MQPFSLNPELFTELKQVLPESTAEKFRYAIENYLNQVTQDCESQIEERVRSKQAESKAELYNDLRTELATKEFVRAEINEVRAEINEVRAEVNLLKVEIARNNILLKVLIGVALFGFTLFNPSFVELIKALVK
jgi:hypothetical protein